MRPGAPQQSKPEDLQRLVLGLRHAMSDLFAGYAIPEEEAGAILRDAVDELIQHCHRTERPRELFLESLENRCVAYVEAQKADEERDDDDDRAPDA